MEIVRRMFEAFVQGLERGNPGAAFDTGTLAEDVEWQTSDLMGAETFRGREGFIEFMRRWTEDFQGYGIQLERLIDAGDDRVVGLLHQWATGTGSGVPVELEPRHRLRAGCGSRDSDVQLHEPGRGPRSRRAVGVGPRSPALEPPNPDIAERLGLAREPGSRR